MPQFQQLTVKHKQRNRNRAGRLAKMPSERKHKAKPKDKVPVIDDDSVVTPETSPEVVDQVLTDAVNPPSPVICPLCRREIAVDDALFNKKELLLNSKPVQVHKNCPAEVEPSEEVQI